MLKFDTAHMICYFTFYRTYVPKVDIMTIKLSRRQQQILDFIQTFITEHQFPPTVRDIQGGCDISSTSVVDYNLQKLQQSVLLRRLPEVSRGIELIGEGLRGFKRDFVRIPIMGNIAAGDPLHVPDYRHSLSAKPRLPLGSMERQKPARYQSLKSN